jgi:tetratricopeptide (TPR) repeat protein
MKQRNSGDHRMNVKNTREWKAAEWDYCGIQADLRMPAFRSAPTEAEVLGRLRGIARRCPQFYPAVMELGLRLLSINGDQRSVQRVVKAFRLMVVLAPPKHFAEEMDGVIENLERLWRFDVSRHLLEYLADRRRLSATLHDSLAHAAARLGDLDAAKKHIAEALRLEPRNKGFWSNKGLYHLIEGDLTEAGIALRKARQVEPKDSVVLGNLEIHQYLGKHGGNYLDYLQRPLDRKRIDRLADQEKWDQADSLRADYNDCRMEAFAQSTLLESPEMLPRLPRLLATLRLFFRFVDQIDSSGVFLNEDISLVHMNFKPIMHKFIFKFGDVDRETMEDVFEALMAYYGFLASRRIMTAAEFRNFRKAIQGTKAELIGKMERYNAIRHDQTMEEEQKEAIREEIFEGDHAWPHI